MPFKSEAQRRWMYANHPSMARRWEKHTKDKKLPKRVKRAFNVGALVKALATTPTLVRGGAPLSRDPFTHGLRALVGLHRPELERARQSVRSVLEQHFRHVAKIRGGERALREIADPARRRHIISNLEALRDTRDAQILHAQSESARLRRLIRQYLPFDPKARTYFEPANPQHLDPELARRWALNDQRRWNKPLANRLMAKDNDIRRELRLFKRDAREFERGGPVKTYSEVERLRRRNQPWISQGFVPRPLLHAREQANLGLPHDARAVGLYEKLRRYRMNSSFEDRGFTKRSMYEPGFAWTPEEARGSRDPSDVLWRLPIPNLVVGPSDVQGKGVRVVRDFPPGKVLAVAAVFANGRLWRSRAGRYINHSTEPNSRLVFASGVGFLLSTRALQSGDELLINYSELAGASGGTTDE